MDSTTPTLPVGKPHYIHEQHNSGCQQFFGPVTGCIFAMPGANVTQNPAALASVSSESAAPDGTGAKAVRKRGPRPKLSAVREARKSPRSEPKALTEVTFRKRGIVNGHLTLLYKELTEDGWIDTRTTEDEFLDLFADTRNDCRIIWSGKYGKSTLVYLFCQLCLEELIELPKGYTLSHILEAHFVDTDGHPLTNLDHGDPYNKQAEPIVKGYIHTMKSAPGRRSRSVRMESLSGDRFRDTDYTDPGGLGDAYDPFDHQDLRLHNKHGIQ